MIMIIAESPSPSQPLETVTGPLALAWLVTRNVTQATSRLFQLEVTGPSETVARDVQAAAGEAAPWGPGPAGRLRLSLESGSLRVRLD
jgi:hypothetical protein